MNLPRTLGRYEVSSRLASGGMAEILLGRVRGPAGFHRPVVLKRVLPHLAESEEFRAMFVDEARIVAGLRHPNVVQVHELGEEDGELFLAMEYLAGESVSGLMRRLATQRRPLPVGLAAHLIAEACAGLHAAHTMTDDHGEPLHVVHRDVSPQNLFVTYDGHVKVLDFGVAKARARLARTHTGHAKGKFGYMSPEQCRREEVDARTDVFALGIVLWELLTGRRLFHDDSELAMVRAICDDPVRPPSELRPECPESLDRICLRALEKEPLDRFDSAEEMRRELVRALGEMEQAPRDETARDELASLMRGTFADRVEEKAALVRDAQAVRGRAEGAGRNEEATALARPVARRRDGVIALVALFVAAGGLAIALWLAPRSGTETATAEDASAAAPAVQPQPSDSAPRAVDQPARAEPAAEHVRVDVRSSPPGARVSVAGESRGETPVSLELPRADEAVAVMLEKEGFDAVTHEVTPSADGQVLDVELTAVEPADTSERRPRPVRRRPSMEPRLEGDDRGFYLFE